MKVSWNFKRAARRWGIIQRAQGSLYTKTSLMWLQKVIFLLFPCWQQRERGQGSRTQSLPLHSQSVPKYRVDGHFFLGPMLIRRVATPRLPSLSACSNSAQGSKYCRAWWIHSNSDFCCKLHLNPQTRIGTNKHMLNHFAKLDSIQLMWWSAKPGRNDNCHPFNEQTARLESRTFNMCLSSMDINHSHISLSTGLKPNSDKMKTKKSLIWL